MSFHVATFVNHVFSMLLGLHYRHATLEGPLFSGRIRCAVHMHVDLAFYIKIYYVVAP